VECLFSLIIPTFNRANFILKTIDSVLNQAYTNFEVIVVDDGSTDDTEKIVKSIQDPRVFYHLQDNAERAVARNTGVKLARGKYVTFLDSDDVLYANHFTEAVGLIEQYQHPSFFHLAYEVKDDSSRILRQNHYRGDLNRQLITGNFLSCMGVFVKREVVLALPFNEDRALSGSEDWELWMRLASRYHLYYSNTITSALVQHQDRSVVNTDEVRLRNRIELAVKYLEKDAVWRQRYGKRKSLMMSHLWLYISLHLIMGGNNRRGFLYWRKAIASTFSIIFSRKSAVVLWKLMH
jgi:glycosyltransferase involved in cell wall biosynthesis